MTRTIVDANLEIFNPTNSGSTPDVTIPSSDIESFSVKSRLQTLLDRGKATIKNDGGTYTDTLSPGDRVKFLTQLDGESSLNHRWTGMIRPVEYADLGANRAEIKLTLDDFVFAVLDTRNVVNSFTQNQISGTSNSVLNSILADEAPEIGRSQIDTIERFIDTVYNSTKLLKAVRMLADRADAVAHQDDKDLVFKRLDDVTKQFDLAATDRSPPSVKENDDKLVNRQRVEGGVGTNVDDSQTTQSSYTRVDSSTRITHQIATRKAEVTTIEVWTRTVGSGDNVVVRVQTDDGGSPKAPGDRDSDIARKALSSDFLDNDGYTTFLMPDHSLVDPNPWLLIESDGSTGQDIGVDGSGNPTYKAHYPFPVAALADDQASIDEYRRRDGVERSRTLKTLDETRDTAFALLRHSKEPERIVSFDADSNRTHNLSVGEVIGVNLPDLGFNATDGSGNNVPQDAIVIDKKDNYDGIKLETEIVAQDVDTV